MGKGKLEKFADMRDYTHVFEYPYSVVDNVPFEMKGNWNRDFFKNDNPIVLELGCGRGEYTVGLGRMYSAPFSELMIWKTTNRMLSRKMVNRDRFVLSCTQSCVPFSMVMNLILITGLLFSINR